MCHIVHVCSRNFRQVSDNFDFEVSYVRVVDSSTKVDFGESSLHFRVVINKLLFRYKAERREAVMTCVSVRKFQELFRLCSRVWCKRQLLTQQWLKRSRVKKTEAKAV